MSGASLPRCIDVCPALGDEFDDLAADLAVALGVSVGHEVSLNRIPEAGAAVFVGGSRSRGRSHGKAQTCPVAPKRKESGSNGNETAIKR